MLSVVRSGSVTFAIVAQVHAEVRSPLALLLATLTDIMVRFSWLFPVVMLILVLVVVDRPVSVVHGRHVVIVGEVLDVVRLMIRQVWRVLNRMLVEMDLLDVVLGIVIVIELGVVATMLAVQMSTVDG